MPDDMRDQLCEDNVSPFQRLIEGLGFCCPYAFIRCNKRTGMIAARLGCSERTVRRWKAKFKLKEISCQQLGLEHCLLPAIRKAGK